MRVLFWTDVFWPTIGGIEVISVRLISALRARGHEFLVVASDAGLGLPDRGSYDGIPIHRFPFSTPLAAGGLDRLLQIRKGVAQVRRDFNPDLVHVACIAPGVMFQLESTRAQPIPLLVTVQQSTSPIQTDGALHLLTTLLRAADWVVCCSESMHAEVRELEPGLVGRSSVVVNAAEPPALAPAPLPMAPPRLLGIGRLATQKGFDLALVAFASLANRFPELRLALVGDGPLRGELQRLAWTLGIQHRVEFRGWVAPDQIAAEINCSTIVLVPSRHEPFGLVALEAAMMARPVVAAQVGGLREVIVAGETGLLVPPEDAQALASALAHLLEHPEIARRLGQAARARALSLYRWERYVNAYDALYGKLHKEMGHAQSG